MGVPEHELYEKADIIGVDFNPTEKMRVEAVLSVIPKDVDSVLDVACGDGRITNQIPADFVVGTDFSQPALKLVKGSKVLSSLPNIPFASRSFDLILCTEVLEHLDDECYIPTVREFARIANKYVLITSPLAEDLRVDLTKCTKCGCVYNMYHHIRSFTPTEMRRLKSLLPGFTLKKSLQVGLRVPYRPPFYLTVKRNICRIYAYWSGSVCPKCGERTGEIPHQDYQNAWHALLGRSMRALELVCRVFLPLRHRYHFVHLYERQD